MSTSRTEEARRVTRSWSEGVGTLLLVADPADPVRSGLVEGLRAAWVNVVWCRDGAEALVEFGRQRPAAVLAAPRLEVVDTPAVVRAMRAAGGQPILVGIGTDDVELAGPALVAGATGVVARPYAASEVVGRLAAELPERDQRELLVYGPLELDARAYRVKVDGVPMEDLPLKEFELLRVLMAHADRVVTPEQIRCALWGKGRAAPTSNAVVVHVGRLRARLAGVAELRTVRGRGYRLTV